MANQLATKDEVSAFLWGWEADDILHDVQTQCRPRLARKKGFRTRLKNKLEKFGGAHSANSNCQITWYHDGRYLVDCMIELIPGDEGRVVNILQQR